MRILKKQTLHAEAALAPPAGAFVTRDSAHAVEKRLRAAVESSPSGLLMVDAAGHIVLVNREVERLFGYSREELLGKPVDILDPDDGRGSHRKAVPALRVAVDSFASSLAEAAPRTVTDAAPRTLLV